MKSLHEMEELTLFQGSTFDGFSRRKWIEDRDTTISAKIITDLTWCRFFYINIKNVMTVIQCGFNFSNKHKTVMEKISRGIFSVITDVVFVPCNWLAISMNLPCAASHSNTSKLDAEFVVLCFIKRREEKRREEKRREEKRREEKRREEKRREEKRREEKRREEKRREEKRREEKRREEKRREEKRREVEDNEGQRGEKKEGTREEEKERRGSSVLVSSTPPCVVSKRFRVFRQNARVCSTCGRLAATHKGVLNLHTEACWTRAREREVFSAPSRATYHATTQNHTTPQHHNTPPTQHTTPHVHTHTPPHQVYTHAHNTIDNRP